MLHLVDQSLEAFLRAEVPLPADQIDVSFDAPDRDWSARTSRPTVDLYLWDIRVSLIDRASGVEVFHDEEGKTHRTMPKPRIDLRYLVTAWTTEVRDEHQLLGSLLAAFYGHGELPESYLQGGYAGVRPVPRITVAHPDGRENADLWSALGGRLKPALDLVVTATLDVALAHEVGPPVTRYELGLADTRTAERASRRGLAGDAGSGVVRRDGGREEQKTRRSRKR